MPSRTLATLLGGVITVAVLGVGAADAYHAVRNWDRLGPLPPGQALSEFRVAMLDGDSFTDADLRGQVSVVTFWATWCPACRSEIEDLDEIDEALSADGDVQFVAVNWEGQGLTPEARRGTARAYRDRNGLTLPIAVDNGAMARALRVGPIPHTVVVDGRGVIRHVHQGRVQSSTIIDEVHALRDER